MADMPVPYHRAANETVDRSRFYTQSPAVMSEGEILTRAREAFIAEHRPAAWFARRIRRGWHDRKLRAVITALRDTSRPVGLIVSHRDEATAALAMKASPGLASLDVETQELVANALLTAIRITRRG